MHTTIIKSIKLFILRFRIIALHSNVILLFTKREDEENREKMSGEQIISIEKINWRTARVNFSFALNTEFFERMAEQETRQFNQLVCQLSELC